ncbi:MAG: V-type ATPase subunit [Firmicutes bacterium]|nr:V-type ATPase subunit [Bacillota bacterium]
MNAALTAKILARRAKLESSGFAPGKNSDLIRFLLKRSEREFATNFANGQKSKNLQHYLELWRGINKLDTTCSKAMKRIIGTEIDLQNILWVYRLKRFYGIFGDKTYGFLVPVRYRLSAGTLAKIVACKDIATFQTEVSAKIYNNVFENFAYGSISPEQRISNALKICYKAESRHSHMALLCWYLYESGQVYK